ncbi:uncharacterized protein DMAD_00864 [Drosophila madeirensis]|uniref:MICOS complex subunit MIC13 n=1 Tax=Drosophila madeirensis TaxID=30013 RepID=A0AAU9FZN9_DROMD
MFKSVVDRVAGVLMTVYITNYFGVWGSAEDSERLLKSMSESVGAMIKWMASEDDPNLNAADVYNRGVKKSFLFIIQLPEHITSTYTSVTNEAKQINLEMSKIFRTLSQPQEFSRYLDMLEGRLLTSKSLTSIKEAEEMQHLAQEEQALKEQALKEQAQALTKAEEKKFSLMNLSNWSMWQFWKNQMGASLMQKSK